MDIFIQFEKKPRLFRNPHTIISCYHPEGFAEAFQAIETALAQGYYVAGFFSYEAGYLFEDCLRENKAYEFPLLCMGVYDPPQKNTLTALKEDRPVVRNIRLNISRGNYGEHIEKIREYIAAGDVYQITYCIKMRFSYAGDSFALYATLLREQPVPYPAYVKTDRFHILSLSPEMFLKKQGTFVTTKPMKGTWQRGTNILADLAARRTFQCDVKNRAENVMIADLLRNDLGRVGTNIRAPRLFEIAGYRTLFQMTSTVTGEVAQDIPVYELFKALFPSGSVTGAPKIRAMQIIRQLEQEERKIYTGAIGYITPRRHMFFNIPIRTILLQNGQGEMGIGGGIVWDSTPQGEWDEGLLKARFLTGLGDVLPMHQKATGVTLWRNAFGAGCRSTAR